MPTTHNKGFFFFSHLSKFDDMSISNLSTSYVLLSAFVSKLLKTNNTTLPFTTTTTTYANNICFLHILCFHSQSGTQSELQDGWGNGSPQLISCRRSKLLIEEIMGVSCY
jgi:hypothetical protein